MSTPSRGARPAGPTSRDPGPGPGGPTRLTQRLWGPDLARGVALLGIALANMYYYLPADQPSILMKDAAATGWDAAVNALVTLTMDNRGFTLFSLLFGYGIGMLHARSLRRGEKAGVFLTQMLRRHGVLLVIGLAHAVLLFAGDIIVTYAILGMLLSVLAVAPRWTQVIAAVGSVPALLMLGAADSLFVLAPPGNVVQPDVTSDSFWVALQWRAVSTVGNVTTMIVLGGAILLPMLMGLWLHRWGLFERAASRPRYTAALAAGGIVTGLVGAVPATWVVLGHVELPGWVLAFITTIHQVTGLVCAVGLAALAALAGACTPRLLAPLRDLGRISMSAYLAQSVVAVAIYPGYTLGWYAHASPATAAALSLTTWLVTIALAVALARGGHRGPVEWVFRRLAYGRGKSSGAADVGPSGEAQPS